MLTSLTSLVTDYYPTFQQITSTYSQPVRETFVKISHRRNPLLSVIKIALLQFKDRGTKLSFVVNGLKFDEPTWSGRLGRTISCYTNPEGNASAKYYYKLLEDIRLAYQWYAEFETAATIFDEMKKGLNALQTTYPRGEVNNFVEKAIAIVEGQEIAIDELENEQEEESASEEFKSECSNTCTKKQQIKELLKEEIDNVIRTLINAHFIHCISEQFETIEKFENNRDQKQLAGVINETIRAKTTELNQLLLRTIRSTIDA